VRNVQSSRRSVLDFLSPSESPPAPARAPQLAPSTRISRIVALMVVLGWVCPRLQLYENRCKDVERQIWPTKNGSHTNEARLACSAISNREIWRVLASQCSKYPCGLNVRFFSDNRPV
jgi:hypothetical protein